MTKSQKIWTAICLAAVILSELLVGGIATTFLNFKTVFGPMLSILCNKYPILIILFMLPEIVAVGFLAALSLQYSYKNKIIKYLWLVFLILFFITIISLVYIAYELSFVSFP